MLPSHGAWIIEATDDEEQIYFDKCCHLVEIADNRYLIIDCEDATRFEIKRISYRGQRFDLTRNNFRNNTSVYHFAFAFYSDMVTVASCHMYASVIQVHDTALYTAASSPQGGSVPVVPTPAWTYRVTPGSAGIVVADVAAHGASDGGGESPPRANGGANLGGDVHEDGVDESALQGAVGPHVVAVGVVRVVAGCRQPRRRHGAVLLGVQVVAETVRTVSADQLLEARSVWKYHMVDHC